MRFTEFWERMETRFGKDYARSVAADYRVPQLSATIDDAIAEGVDVKLIWRAVCVEFDIPESLR